jgi:hypothetical protein
MRFFVTPIVLALAAHVAAAGVLPPIPQLPAAALKPPDASDQPAEDPAKLADRITENTKRAGDQLAKDDTGNDTRKTQDQILKDIDALLKQSQNPPPPPMGGGSSNNSNNDQSSQGSQSRKPNDGQSQGQGGSRGNGKSPQGSGGGSRKSNGGQKGGSWRDRRNSNGGAQQAGKQQPMPQQANNTGKPSPMPQANAGNPANPGAGGSQAKAKPDLPLDEAITKQVWGHLPERLRQQMSQYYRERFMPKYGDLLRQYYAALAEREKAAKQP